MLAAATGRPAEPVPLALAAWTDGEGVDAETYHPVAADGGNPPVGGRVAAVKGGMTIRDRPFLVGVHLTVWVPAPHGERIGAALRRPVWGLRLGRSQDAVCIRAVATATLVPAGEAEIGHALAPAGGHAAPGAVALRLAETVSADRLSTSYGSYLWCPRPGGRHQVHDAYRDGDQAVWLQWPDPADPSVAAQAGADSSGQLAQVLAKSARGSGLGRPETLAEHSATVREAVRVVASRIGPAGPIAAHPRFWDWAELAALLHDAGKVAEGFQRQLRPGAPAWGERHEVLSLAYVDLLTTELSDVDRLMVAAGVGFHHRCLTSDANPTAALSTMYPHDTDWSGKFGRDRDPPPGGPPVQVPLARHAALLAWLAAQLGQPPPPPDGVKLWQRARDTFRALTAAWAGCPEPERGLLAVLLQGAVTLADHSGSAHVRLQDHLPLPRDYLSTLPAPYRHQSAAGGIDGHLVLLAPTGSGKTEAGLAWASRQLETMPGQPRLVWVLPYRASIDALVDRFGGHLTPAAGQERPDIGVLHATAARTLLDRAVGDDCVPGRRDAIKARGRAGAMRLFAQRVRIATAHQLLRAAVAGPRYAAVLLEQANAVVVLDELHAYEPEVFGRICAAAALWERLGSRTAVLSATLAQPMLDLITDSLAHRPELVAAPAGTAPVRQRVVLDEQPITAPAALERIRGWLADRHSVLAVANTIATAQELFEALAPAAAQAWPDDPDAAVLLHSRFRQRDRAAIERRILARYPERVAGAQQPRRGGLVVSTQVLEVSLCLDLDRGVTEEAPVEALAQRAGRVNRRGGHPDGPVEFRIHTADRPAPYDPGAVDAARQALYAVVVANPVFSEDTVRRLLDHAYDTPWGRDWAREARAARDQFAAEFLTFTDPFHDRSEFADRLDEQFDGVDAVLADDLADYQALAAGPDGDPLLAAGLLIPIRLGQRRRLRATGHAAWDPHLRVTVIDAPYQQDTGLDLRAGPSATLRPETIL
jgi:CRISPR-associated endonuclease/helicase Cas3